MIPDCRHCPRGPIEVPHFSTAPPPAALFECRPHIRQEFGVWQGSTEKLVTPTWINPTSLSESMLRLEVRSGGKQIYPV